MEENAGVKNEGNDEEMQENEGDIHEKKPKKRQRKILADLQKQIEFYFSEPNLQKDRFLRQQLSESENGCVEIKTIASFNRMKQLCKDIVMVVKAMKLCPSVEVIDDKWVKPVQPLSEPKNVDAMTVYIERLPSNADHDWVKNRFSTCGNVVYVSLPRYKTTRDLKGFGFVEFEKESEARAAVEMFAEKPENKEEDGNEEKKDSTENPLENSKGICEKQQKKNKKQKTKLNESENEDTKAKSKKAKHKREDSTCAVSASDTAESTRVTDEIGKCKRKNENLEQGESECKKKCGEDINEPSNRDDSMESKKRKRKRSEDSAEEGPSSKKNNEESVGDVSNKRKKEFQGSDVDGTSCKKKKEGIENYAGDTLSKSSETDVKEEENEEEMEDKKKKKRKRKKKEKEKVENLQLRVIPKTEWLSLKKEYLKLQRAAMKEAKAKLRIEFEAKKENASKPAKEYQDRASEEDRNVETERKAKQELSQKLERQPGVVLKFFTEKDADRKQLRSMFSTISPVAYLDKEDDSTMGYVRFVTKEGCDKVMETSSKSDSIENVKIEKLTEKEDTEYWERLNNQRLERFEGKKKSRNGRGRQKITKKMDARNAKKREHVHFDE